MYNVPFSLKQNHMKNSSFLDFHICTFFQLAYQTTFLNKIRIKFLLKVEVEEGHLTIKTQIKFH